MSLELALWKVQSRLPKKNRWIGCTGEFTKIVPYEAYKKLDLGLNVVHT